MPRNILAQFAAQIVGLGPMGDVRRMERRSEVLQRDCLVRLLNDAADTEWGRTHGFRELLATADPIASYQLRVPLTQYAHFDSSIERMRRGESNILWPGTCSRFGLSGGTYSTGKVVPANPEMLERTIRGGVAMTVNYLAQTGNLAAVTGAIIPLTGRLFSAADYPGTILGNFSGLLTQYRLEESATKGKKLPKWFPDTVESLYLADWDGKLNRLADVTMTSDVRYIALIPTWGLVFFRKLIARNNQRFSASATCVRDIWPKLQMVVSGGMALEPYRELLSKTIGPPDIDFLETYGAMEAGLIAFQTSLSDRHMLLNTEGGNFFEFIRYEDFGRDDAERFWVSTIERGQKYVPVISNANGLWAYVLGDVVEFADTQPPMLRVVGRTAETLSLYREGLTGDVARSALSAICKQAGAQLLQFHVTYSPAEQSDRRYHEWYLEFSDKPPDGSHLALLLDEALRSLSASYCRVRDYHGLDVPRVVTVAHGAMERAQRRLGKELDAQTKVPCMKEGRDFASALISELNPTVGQRELVGTAFEGN
jgi:hypothetical protein